MEMLKQPPPLSLVGDISQNFKRWEQRFLLYFKASGAEERLDEHGQNALLLHVIGDDALEVYNTFEFEVDKNGEKKLNVKTILEKFRNYCSPAKNETMQRHLFFTREKKEGESFGEFVTALKTLSSDCNFDKLKDSLIKSQIIRGIGDCKLQEALLQDPDLDLHKCIRICKAAELATENVKKITTEMQVNNISRTTHKNENRNLEKPQDFRDRNQNLPETRDSRQAVRKQCMRCGYYHGFKCPAFGYRCKKCNRYGHYAKMCRTPSQVHAVNQDQDSDDSDIVLGG
ncbi:uncharacterized protein LOC114357383 [Ostrinia furnacalis]|uniref:uncharacterized protein LOC114357383 n=1 Tax=Ostrinia furnacalis TaxID=93504 RepID=UPI00103A90DE|nr:uncharacterized protein LOC114357383 [Ostrinia furnacalis]